MSNRTVSRAVALSTSLVLAMACGSESSTFQDANNSANDVTGSGTGTFQPPDTTDAGANEDSGVDINACATDKQEAKLAPLDLVIMQDTSGSMWGYVDGTSTTTKWDALKTALMSFMNDPASAGIGVGVSFFPQFENNRPNSCTSAAECGSGSTCVLKYCSQTGTFCNTQADCPGNPNQNTCTESYKRCGAYQEFLCRNDADCGNVPLTPTTCDRPLVRGYCTNSTVSCNVPDYSSLAIPIATLPTAAPAINVALQQRIPSGLTPTHAALQGAIASAKARKTERPDAVVAVVLSTDGIPNTKINGKAKCTDDAVWINAVATAARDGNPSVKTFVIGVLSPQDNTQAATDTLNGIAAAGGTGAASIIGTSPTTQADFIAALQRIRAQSLPCELTLPVPKAGTPDYNKVNVIYTDPTTQDKSTIQYVGSAATCNATTGGWYYDVDPKAGGTPTKVILCATTCASVQKGLGSVEIVQGCATSTDPPTRVPK